MKKMLSAVLIFFSAVALAQEAADTPEEFQLGFVVGSNSGISFKYKVDSDNAVDGSLAYAFDGRHGSAFSLNYLFDGVRSFQEPNWTQPVRMYYGIGVRVLAITSGSDNGKSRMGVRLPIGVNYDVFNPNVELFAELAPVVDVAPSTDVYGEGALGVRYRF